MNTKAVDKFFQNADQPDNVRHRIYLLRNLRKIKNDIAKKNIEVVRSQILGKLNDESNCAAVEFRINEIETKLTKILKTIPPVVDTQSSNRQEKSIPEPSLMSFNFDEPKLESDILFLSTVELLGTRYDATRNSTFFQQREQIVDILNKMKKNNVPDKELEHLQTEFLKLCLVKNKFERNAAA